MKFKDPALPIDVRVEETADMVCQPVSHEKLCFLIQYNFLLMKKSDLIVRIRKT
jgi:hypothetical protein